MKWKILRKALPNEVMFQDCFFCISEDGRYCWIDITIDNAQDELVELGKSNNYVGREFTVEALHPYTPFYNAVGVRLIPVSEGENEAQERKDNER